MAFRDIVGHTRLVSLLARSIQRERLPPSLIFAGPGGVGKRLTAVATAQALNCVAPIAGSAATERRPAPAPTAASHAGSPAPAVPVANAALEPLGFDACGTCPPCARIARGVHPDVLLVEPGDSGSIKIDDVRELVDRAAYRPFEGRRRVVIIDEADALVPAAQNALLKTLEEPPPSSVFMLVTARPDVLLATVRSRCPSLRFRPLDPGDIAAALVRRGWTEIDARAAALTADGSLGRALASGAGELAGTREVAIRVLAQAAASDDPRRRLDAAKELLAKTGASGAGDREHLGAHLRAMTALLRDIELLSTRADARALANPDVQPAIERLSAFRGERGIRAFKAVDRALVALDRNAGVKIVADWVALQL